ncbi:MAG: hypothetical protein K2W96_08745 [Gemmataceae bacterium]|nr:hypothetical protein [Gemmataceae bacterium]
MTSSPVGREGRGAAVAPEGREASGASDEERAADLSGSRRCPRIIHGVAHRKRGTPEFTLSGCRRIGTTGAIWASGTQRSERYSADILYEGAHLGSAPAFSGACVSFTGLAAWAWEYTGLHRGIALKRTDDATEARVTYKQPEPITAVLGDSATLSLESSCDQRATLRAGRIREELRMRLSFSSQLGLSDIVSRYVLPLQNLLSLACDAPNAVSRFWLAVGEEWGRPVEARLPWIYTGDEAASATPSERLFGLEDVQGRFGDIVRKWQALHEEMAPAFAIYFGVSYRARLFTDTQLQLAVQALALYTKARDPEGTIPTIKHELGDALLSLDDGKRALVMRLLEGHPVLAAERAVGWAIARHGDVFKVMAAPDGKRFAGRLLNTLHYVYSRDRFDSLAVRGGADFYHLGQQVRWLIKLCLLDELGFSTEWRKALLGRHPQALWLAGRIGLQEEPEERLAARPGA